MASVRTPGNSATSEGTNFTFGTPDAKTLAKRSVQELAPAEPVVPVKERFDTVGLRRSCPLYVNSGMVD